MCDLGCGNGFYTLMMARRVGSKGVVYAVDIQNEMLHLLSQRAKAAELANIKTVLGTRVDPMLPEHAIDLVLLVDVYHELSNPEEMLKAIRRSLKPHGRLVLGEFRLEDPDGADQAAAQDEQGADFEGNPTCGLQVGRGVR